MQRYAHVVIRHGGYVLSAVAEYQGLCPENIGVTNPYLIKHRMTHPMRQRVEDRWNDQQKADKMIRSAVTQLAGEKKAKWQKAPFNNDWCCSVIVSQDPLACDVVGMDMLIHEWPEFGSFNYCDEYLREAATIPNPVTGVVYDPERDGTPLTAPLGLMEHADKERRYTKLDMIYVKQ